MVVKRIPQKIEVMGVYVLYKKLWMVLEILVPKLQLEV